MDFRRNDYKYHYIYFHCRKTDGRIFYVGKGKGARINSNDGRGEMWHRVVRKYGIIRIKVFINLTNEEAEKLEIELIAILGRRDRGKGLLVNNTDGGGGKDNSFSRPVLQYDKKLNLIGKYNSMSDASIINNINDENIRSVCHKKTKTAGGFIWRFADDNSPLEYKKNNGVSSRSKKIQQYDLDGNFIGEFESIGIASKHTNIPPQGISMCCRKVIKKAHGYIWIYSKDKSDINDIVISLNKPKICPLRRKRVGKIDLNGNILKIYDSLEMAARENGINFQGISRVCLGEKFRKTYKGFKWKYLN